MRVNGTEVGTIERNGGGPITASFEIERGVLLPRGNQIEIESVDLGAPSIVFLDRVAIEFHREHVAERNRLEFGIASGGIHRIEGFGQPSIDLYRTSGTGGVAFIEVATAPTFGGASTSPSPPFDLEFSLPTTVAARFEAFTDSGARSPRAAHPVIAPEILDPPTSIDLIVIAPRSFHGELARLVSLRRSQGWTVALIDLEAVFDQFDGGRATSNSVRNFLEHTTRQWPSPAPSAVLLVRDSTYDPAAHLGPNPRQVLPTRLIATPEFETASDHWFGDLEGIDAVPELVVGRLPVATMLECRSVVDKLIAHAARIATPSRPLFVNDDEIDFTGASAEIGALFPFGTPLPTVQVGSQPIDLLRQVLEGEWNAGPTFVHYTGHGSRQDWAAESIVAVADVPLLSGNPLPIVTAMNCLNGYFTHPTTPSLGEALLVTPRAGAIAYWGPTAITSQLGQQELAKAFYTAALATPGASIGEVIRSAQTQFAQHPRVRSGEWRAHLETWVLLGDPMMRIDQLDRRTGRLVS